MICIAKCIQNKKINTSKSNDIKDFEGISKAAWELILSIYNSGWDLLIANDHKTSFRQKVASKFTPKVNLEKNSKKGERVADKPTRIERIPSLILAKSPKEVKEISKYFKPTKPVMNNKAKNFLYTQCYDLRSLGLDERTTLILEKYKRTQWRALYKIVYLIYSYRWSMLRTVHPTLNDHVSSMRPTCGVHVV